MKVLNNPFFILNCTPEDNKSLIHEQAEMQSFDFDELKCKEAESILTNPKKRLEAEISWFPGFNKKLVEERIKLAKQNMIQYINELSFKKTDYFLAEANMLCFGLEQVNNAISWREADIKFVIIHLCSISESIDLEDTIESIEIARKIAKIPSKISKDEIISLLDQQRLYYKKTLYNFLNQIESNLLVRLLTQQIEKVTTEGKEYCKWSLLKDIITDYENDVTPFFEKQERFIKADLDTIINKVLPSSRADYYLDDWYNKLEKDLLLWDRIAQPIQVLKKSLGVDDERSERLFYEIRELSLVSHNKYKKTNFSIKITSLCEKVFAELRNALETAENDNKILKNFGVQKQQDDIIHTNEMKYHHSWGLIIKDTIDIDTKSITINGNVYYFEKITDLRWGITDHYINGSYTGRTRDIQFKYLDNIFPVSIKTDEDQTYYDVTDRLCKGPVHLIIQNILKKLKSGQTLELANTRINNYGIQLKKENFLTKNYKMFKWSDIDKNIRLNSGCFSINSQSDKNYSLDVQISINYNGIVLYLLLTVFFKSGNGIELTSIE